MASWFVVSGVCVKSHVIPIIHWNCGDESIFSWFFLATRRSNVLGFLWISFWHVRKKNRPSYYRYGMIWRYNCNIYIFSIQPKSSGQKPRFWILRILNKSVLDPLFSLDVLSAQHSNHIYIFPKDVDQYLSIIFNVPMAKPLNPWLSGPQLLLEDFAGRLCAGLCRHIGDDVGTWGRVMEGSWDVMSLKWMVDMTQLLMIYSWKTGLFHKFLWNYHWRKFGC